MCIRDREKTESEMLYVGGGAGMAPMRSHLYHLFKTLETGRKVSYWYGGRSRRELFYLDHFKQLEDRFDNFKFYVVLSEPLEEDNWIEKEDINDENSVIPFIDTKKYHELKNTETISQGMMPKLHNCFESLEKGVQEIRIGNSSIFSQKNQFTKIKK